MRFASIAAAFLLPFVAARSLQQPIQVFLHPSPATPQYSTHTSPTLTVSQAKAVLAHHLGEKISDFDEIPQDEGLWSHLVSMWRGEQDAGRPRVVIIGGGVMAQDVLPSTLSTPSFYLPEGTSTQALIAPYLHRASHLLSHILDAVPALTKSFKDAFDLAGTKAAVTLSHELSCLTALTDSLPWADESSAHTYPWEAISISGFNRMNRNDELWETGRLGVKAGLQAMSTPNSPPLLLIILPSSSSNIGARAQSPKGRFASSSLSPACFASNSSCASSTNCNGRGVCALKTRTQPGASNAECWGCKCASGFAGVDCQKADYSVPFVILVFSTILLVGVLIGSIGLLYTVGDTKLPSTLTLAIGGHMKRE